MRKIILFTISSVTVLCLVGCVGGMQPTASLSPSEAKSSSPVSTSMPGEVDSSRSPLPTSTNIADIPWDLYPGLKTKLEGLAAESNCEGLSELLTKYGTEDAPALADYIGKLVATSNCQ